jgi:hypothetical protein
MWLQFVPMRSATSRAAAGGFPRYAGRTERLLVVSLELAAVITRIRQPDGSVGCVASYDSHEGTWNRRCRCYSGDVADDKYRRAFVRRWSPGVWTMVSAPASVLEDRRSPIA